MTCTIYVDVNKNLNYKHDCYKIFYRFTAQDSQSEYRYYSRSRSRTISRSRSRSRSLSDGARERTKEKDSNEIALNNEVKSTIENRINKNKRLGPPLHSDFVKLCENVVKNGLDDKERMELIEKFPPPNNCTIIEPPKLNTQIESSIQPTVKIRDNRIVKKQQKITACLSACGAAVALALSKEEENNPMIPILSDIASLMSDLQYDESVIRKSIILLGQH